MSILSRTMVLWNVAVGVALLAGADCPRAAGPTDSLPPAILQALDDAHNTAEDLEYLQAASILEQLSVEDSPVSVRILVYSRLALYHAQAWQLKEEDESAALRCLKKVLQLDPSAELPQEFSTTFRDLADRARREMPRQQPKPGAAESPVRAEKPIVAGPMRPSPIVRSLLAPGWGQISSGRRGPGAAFMVGEVAALVLSVGMTFRYNGAVSDYDDALAQFNQSAFGNSTDLRSAWAEVTDSYESVTSAEKTRNLVYGLAAAIYAINVFDILVINPRAAAAGGGSSSAGPRPVWQPNLALSWRGAKLCWSW